MAISSCPKPFLPPNLLATTRTEKEAPMFYTPTQLLHQAEIALIHKQLGEIDNTNDPKIKELHQRLAQIGIEQKQENNAQ